MQYPATHRRANNHRQARAHITVRLTQAARAASRAFAAALAVGLLAFLCAAPLPARSRPLSGLSAPAVVPVGAVGGDAAWGDYDRDGDLDLLVAGTDSGGARVTTLLENTLDDQGRRVLVETPSGLPRVENASLDWGDYDGDGYLDVLLTGSTGYANGQVLAFAAVYRNIPAVTNASAAYSGVPTPRAFALAVSLPGVYDGDGAWGDFDNDGRLDALITGYTAGGAPFTRLYRNDGHGGLVDSGFNLPALGASSAAWGDYDNDNDLDLALMGRAANNSLYTLVFRSVASTGMSGFPTQTSLTGMASGSLAWIDLENDGDLDLLVTGNRGDNATAIQPATMLYRYSSSAAGFTALNSTGLPALWNSSVSVGDWNNDGYADLLMNGLASASRVSAVYASSQGAGFVPAAQLPDGAGLSAAWGDLDRDHTLDLALSGVSDGGRYTTYLYTNDNPPPASNQPPSAPELVAACWDGSILTLDWSRSEDDHITPTGKDITYNLRLGASPFSGEVAAPMALESGLRLLPAPGPAGANTRAVLRGLPAGGTVSWSVQGIDAALAGGPFSPTGAAPLGKTVAASDTIFMLEDGAPVNFDVLANDNPAFAPLRVHWKSGVSIGSLSSPAPGVYSYTPPADWSGDAVFLYKAAGSGAYCTQALVTIHVMAVEDAPRQIKLSPAKVLEGLPAGTLVGTLSAVDPDIGDTHIFQFAPDNGNHDNENFVIATDSAGLELRQFIPVAVLPATAVTIECAGGCGEVTASPKGAAVVMSEDGDPQPFALSLRANTPRPGETLTWSAPQLPAMGTLAFSPTTTPGQEQTLQYQPLSDRSGEDTFTLRVRDSLGSSDEFTVRVTVLPVNDPPALEAIAPLTLTEWAGEQAVPLAGLSAGPADESAQPLEVSAETTAPALLHDLRVEEGALRFTVADSDGEAQVTVTVSDGEIEITRAFTVTILPGDRYYIPLGLRVDSGE